MAANLNLDAITAWLQSLGLNKAQIAGVEGNFSVETGGSFSPTSYNPKEQAIGIAQWEGGRRAALDAYAKQTGGSETDIRTQLGYLKQEFQGSESGAYRALLAATTPEQAATVFDQQFERSATSSLPARVKAAQDIAGGKVDNSAGSVVGSIGQAVSDPMGTLSNAFGSIFSGWQQDITTLALKVTGATLAGALVVVGAYEALKGAQ